MQKEKLREWLFNLIGDGIQFIREGVALRGLIISKGSIGFNSYRVVGRLA
jgi:hypothetical protein